MKLAKKAGMNVRQVITGEEIQYDPNGEDNQRGLAGAVAMYHVAAAAAAAGKSLDEVAEIAQKYADNMASVTVKVTDATHPQNGMSFGDLGETDQMEIGAGQHGEGGGVCVPMMSSKETVAAIAKPLSEKIGLKSGDKAFVMINGCGATTMMEMLVLYKDTVEYLKAQGVEVVGNMVGEILTVQEAGGFQMNLAKWDDEIEALWNTPVADTGFFAKGLGNTDWGMKNRLSRLFNPKSGNTVMLAFDHGYIMGPTAGLERLDVTIAPLCEYADVLMGTRGALRSCIPPTVNKAVCLRATHDTSVSFDDMSVGSGFGCEMERTPRYFSTASRLLAELGASFVKTYYCEGFEKVVASCPVPIVIAGGKKLLEQEALEMCYKAMASGAHGVDMGRNVFQSEHPIEMMLAIRKIVHEGFNGAEAFEFYQDAIH